MALQLHSRNRRSLRVLNATKLYTIPWCRRNIYAFQGVLQLLPSVWLHKFVMLTQFKCTTQNMTCFSLGSLTLERRDCCANPESDNTGLVMYMLSASADDSDRGRRQLYASHSLEAICVIIPEWLTAVVSSLQWWKLLLYFNYRVQSIEKKKLCAI